LRFSSYIFFLLIFLVITINYFVDPGKIYYQKILADSKAKDYAQLLFNSSNGLIQTSWNERLIKTELTKSSALFDCIVIGSSHTMQISSFRNTGNINKQCKSLLNLSVSGGSIEDLAIFSYLVLNNSTFPSKVFIDIDPWTLKFKMDSRYGVYKEYYNKMNNMLFKEKKDEDRFSYLIKTSINLINYEYLVKSIEFLLSNDGFNKIITLANKEIKYPTSEFLYKNGYVESITLPDGSHVYNKKWILNQIKKNKKIKIGGGNYQIKGKIYEQEAVEYLQKLLNLYKYYNIKVSFIMTPYHPNVFKNGETKPVVHMRKVDEVSRKLAKDNNIKVYGTFFPELINCKKEEFFDFMHATTPCLNKIDFSSAL
jgi:hypothetical protein